MLSSLGLTELITVKMATCNLSTVLFVMQLLLCWGEPSSNGIQRLLFIDYFPAL